MISAMGEQGYTTAMIAELALPDGWSPIRRALGIEAFGVNAWTARAAGDRVINEHEEDPGSEELYIVTRGRAVFELDGERREVPEGTFVFVPAGVKRTAFGEDAGTTIV